MIERRWVKKTSKWKNEKIDVKMKMRSKQCFLVSHSAPWMKKETGQ